jgi:hypothetical protein
MKIITDYKIMEFKSLVQSLVSVKSEDRPSFIEEYLSDNGIPFNILEFPDGRNIEVVKFSAKNAKEIIFFSHFDISKDTIEGANDNSSSVAIMLNVAKFIQEIDVGITVRIVFNDTEEILGALLNKEVNIDILKSQEIISKVGSFQYLKRFKKKDDILGIFDIELSGIGNSIFIAESSGLVNCSGFLIGFLCGLAKKNGINHMKIPFLSSDMISIHTIGIPGIVIGAIPGYEGLKYLKESSIQNGKENSGRDHFPSSWKNIHTSKDNFYAISEKSMKMVYDFIILIIKNITQ